MPINLTGPRIGPATWAETSKTRLGPRVGFFAAVLAGFGLLIAARVSALTPDLTMPVVASLFLASAAAIGAIAWWRGRADQGDVTYRDVAGALTLIGICAAAAIDADQMMRIVQSTNTAAD